MITTGTDIKGMGMSSTRHYIEGRALKLKPNIREHLSELQETKDFLKLK